MFASYVRDHKELQKACGLSGPLKRKNYAYIRIFKLYRSAVSKFLPRTGLVAEGKNSAVAEGAVEEDKPDPSCDSATALASPTEGDPFAKFRYKTERLGRQYYSTKDAFQRESKRRRYLGGGRAKTCSNLRESQHI